ncbi:argininosuccinate lyase [Fusibacter bizertensis]
MKAWQGRFVTGSSDLLEKFNASIGFDYKLFSQDIKGSIAHSSMLQAIGVITENECATIQDGLLSIESELSNRINQGETNFDVKYEDIHMMIESMLVEKVGDVGKKLHTARSRNDQVAVDLRLYTISKILGIQKLTFELMKVLIELSEAYLDDILPGYTHLQRAQPVRLGFHLMTYFQMFKRDYERFSDTLKRTSVLPLGSGALAGVNYETNRDLLKKLLAFNELSDHAMDAVSDRDFVIEFNSTAAILMMHLSRFSEELILWSSSEYAFVEISDAFSTGSSIMPQKKNPDVAELVRGKTGRVYGNLMGILTVMKGLPLAYNKDMQEDKEGLFDTVETLEMCLEVFTAMLGEIKFNTEKMKIAAKLGYLNATDLADYLVLKGLPFRDCHHITGNIVKKCIQLGCAIEELSMDELKQFSVAFESDVYAYLELDTVVEGKKSFGSTSKKSTLQMIENAKSYIEQL